MNTSSSYIVQLHFFQSPKGIWIIMIMVVTLQLSVKAQELEVISASGDSFKENSGSCSFTLGETIIETWLDGNAVLTGGFQQPLLAIVTVINESIDFMVQAYPNPTSDHITLHTDNFEKIFFMLFDPNGKVIRQQYLIEEDTHISFEGLANAVYYLKVNKNNVTLRTFKIFKNK